MQLALLRLAVLACPQSLVYRKVTMDYSYFQSTIDRTLNQFDQPELGRFNLCVKLLLVAPVFRLQDIHVF